MAKVCCTRLLWVSGSSGKQKGLGTKGEPDHEGCPRLGVRRSAQATPWILAQLWWRETAGREAWEGYHRGGAVCASPEAARAHAIIRRWADDRVS